MALPQVELETGCSYPYSFLNYILAVFVVFFPSVFKTNWKRFEKWFELLNKE